MSDFVLFKAGKATIRAAIKDRFPDGRLRVEPYFFQDEVGSDTGPFIGGAVMLSPGDTYTLIPSDASDVLEAFINGAIQSVSELPDRTSPEDQPDMMLVTADELRLILNEMAVRTGLVQPGPAQSAKDGLNGGRPERSIMMPEDALSKLSIPSADVMILRERRMAAATAAFELYDFGSTVVASENGFEWTEPGDTMTRVIYIETELGAACAHGLFTVRFVPGQSEIEEAYATQSGNTFGSMPEE